VLEVGGSLPADFVLPILKVKRRTAVEAPAFRYPSRAGFDHESLLMLLSRNDRP
jgi:hypothetical protein